MVASRSYLLALALGVPAFGACSPQVDPDYRGQSMIIIRGSATSSEFELDSTVPVLGWQMNWNVTKEVEMTGTGQFDRMDVEGEFPKSFTLTVTTPPPEPALQLAQVKGPRMAVADILALRDGADWSRDTFPDMPDWYQGAASRITLWYIAGQLPELPEITNEDGTPATLGRGYHLARAENWTEEEKVAKDECFDRVYADLVAKVNAAHGTSYADISDMPEDLKKELWDYSQELTYPCGSDVKATVLDTGRDHPQVFEFVQYSYGIRFDSI